MTLTGAHNTTARVFYAKKGFTPEEYLRNNLAPGHIRSFACHIHDPHFPLLYFQITTLFGSPIRYQNCFLLLLLLLMCFQS